MNRRRVLAGAAVTATGVFLAASLGGARAGEGRGVKEGGTFRVVTAGGFFTIDPALLGNGPAEVSVLRPACAGLLAFPDKSLPAGLRVEPDLAEAQPVVSKDGKTYTFRIRKDARFSDGTPVTARNFLRAFERIFDPSMNSSQEAFFDIIVGATEMLDGKTKTLAGVSAAGRTLTVKLTRRVADFPMLLAGGLCAVPANLKASPDGATAPLPSPAPYYVSEYVPDERVVLERNRYYKGPRPQHVDRFTVDIGADPGDDLRPGSQRRRRTMRSGRHSPSPRSRRTSGDASASTSRSSSWFLPLGCGRSCSTRAVHCSAATSSCGRPSTSRSTAERSRVSSGHTPAP